MLLFCPLSPTTPKLPPNNSLTSPAPKTLTPPFWWTINKKMEGSSLATLWVYSILPSCYPQANNTNNNNPNKQYKTLPDIS